MQTTDCDLCVVEGTIGAVAVAVSAARLGLSVAMVSYRPQLAGVFASLGAIETHYSGMRSALLSEIRERIVAHYRSTCGEDSEEYKTCIWMDPDKPMITFEPHVLRRIVEKLVDSEERITVFRGWIPEAVVRGGRRIEAVRFRRLDGDKSRLTVEARSFVDASYEGDLITLAGLPWCIGREGRDQYGEPHAGKIFTRWVRGRYPIEAARGRLNLAAKSTTLGLYAGSTGEADDNVQAYSYRLCLCCDPNNRRTVTTPPDYDRTRYLGISESPEAAETKRYPLQHRFLTQTLQEMVEGDHLFHGHALPRSKRSWNATNFPGAGKRYAAASMEERGEIERAHLNHALGILYFLQNDRSVPKKYREMAREWGPALDEFTDNDNVPWNLYVREARRLIGEYVIREQDMMIAPGYRRAPIHADSIGITEFPIDSLACTTERMPGTICDGQFFLQELSRPGQIPYRAIYNRAIENLLDPVTPSTTHVAWGTIRQTPTLISICEAAGHAVALALKSGRPVTEIDVEALQLRLLDSRHMISFFNDFDMATGKSWVQAIQFFGAMGFFNTYDAMPDAAVDQSTAQLWTEGAARLHSTDHDAAELARQLPEPPGGPPVDPALLAAELSRAFGRPAGVMERGVTRGALCELLWRMHREKI